MSFTFSPLKIGGGGFSTGISVSPDGLTVLNRVDVDNCYIYNFGTSQWDSLNTDLRLPATAGGGGTEIVSAPSNSAIIYMWLSDGNLYRSVNRGGSFVQLTGFGNHDQGASNGVPGHVTFGARLNGPRMAVDPINPDVLYVGTYDSGVLVSTNAGQGTGSTPTFNPVASVPNSSFNPSYGFLFAFDKNGGNNGTSTNILYCHSYTNGIYKMSAPGGSFSLIAGSTNYAENMAVSPNSVLYVTDSANVFKYIGGALSATYALGDAHSVIIDPNSSPNASSERVIVGTSGGNLNITTTSGISGWSGALSFTRSSPAIPWLAEANEFFMSNGCMAFDATRNLIWFAEGIGVWQAPGGTNSSFVWTSATQGIESLQFNGVISSQNATNSPSMFVWDRGVYQTASPSTYSAHQVSPVLNSIIHCWSMDWASADGTTLVDILDISQTDAGSVAAGKFGLDVSGISTDNGQTWQPFAQTTTMPGTAITASGASAAGQTVITCSTSFPVWFSKGMSVVNNTHPGTTLGWVAAVDSVAKTITMDRNLTGGGVSNLDSLTVNYPGSPIMPTFVVTAQTLSGGNVLHFTGLPTNAVQVFNQVFNLTNPGSIPPRTSIHTTDVQSISGSNVTVVDNFTANVNVGDVIQFVNAGQGGAIAAASSTNFVVTPANDGAFPLYTTDGGATWNAIDLGLPRPMNATFVSGSTTVTVADTSSLLTGASAAVKDVANGTFIPNNTNVVSITNSTQFVMSAAANSSGSGIIRPTTGWGFAYSLDLKNVCADRSDPDTFYLYNSLTGRVYISTDKGVTWPTHSTTPANIATSDGANGGQNLSIQSVPGKPGELFLSGANVSFQNNPLIRSTDHGVTWATVPNITSVRAFGFGKPLASGYPTIWIVGQKSGSFSLWMSNDNCTSWIDLTSGAVPFHALDNVISIDGDKTIYGKVYGTFNYSGAFFGALDSTATSNIVGFSVIHDRGRRDTKMIGY